MCKSKPIPYSKVESVHQVKRNVFCQNYGRCLDRAITKNWAGFSCERCCAYEHEKMGVKEWCQELDHCIALAYAAGAWIPER